MTKKSKKKGATVSPYSRGFTLNANPGSLAAAGAVPATDLPAKPRLSKKKVAKRIALFLLAIVIATVGWFGWKFYENLAKLTGDKNPLSMFSLLHPGPLQESNGRVNILLAGDSADDPGHQGADLTDSIMIVSIDPSNKSAILLSIPRDMWVDIPGYGYSKINAAYEDGDMSLLSQVIQQDFGIQTDYSALIDYTAFRDAVNAVGGITITINSPDPRGLYDPYTHVDLPNGPVTLDGQMALNLARARGDGPGSYGFPQSDFDRTNHQRQMLIAIKEKATSTSTLINPFKIGELADSIGSNVQTDMGVGQLISLYDDSKGIKNSAIQSVSLNSFNGQDLLASYYAPGEQDALIPAAGFDNFTIIQNDISQLLGNSTSGGVN